MKPAFSSRSAAVVLAMALPTFFLPVSPAHALSLNRESPQIHFPPKYDEQRAAKLSAVLRSEKFHYLGGLTSFWEPEWSTTLVYEGDAKSLNAFLADLHQVEGITVRVTFSPDLSKETGSALQAGCWWVCYSHTSPDTVTIRLNLAAEMLEGDTLEIFLPKP